MNTTPNMKKSATASVIVQHPPKAASTAADGARRQRCRCRPCQGHGGGVELRSRGEKVVNDLDTDRRGGRAGRNRQPLASVRGEPRAVTDGKRETTGSSRRSEERR